LARAAIYLAPRTRRLICVSQSVGAEECGADDSSSDYHHVFLKFIIIPLIDVARSSLWSRP